ncbi:MAG TPA: hypothetical protein VM262_14320 [Acidimicrobiales bacterium]|nr:hypothetical protein [Acidimicrobiales bacterium]
MTDDLRSRRIELAARAEAGDVGDPFSWIIDGESASPEDIELLMNVTVGELVEAEEAVEAAEALLARVADLDPVPVDAADAIARILALEGFADRESASLPVRLVVELIEGLFATGVED